MKKIKIICTLGPSTINKENIIKMKKLGVSLFRINMSHTSLVQLEKYIKLLKKLRVNNICIDTEGAQIRTTKINKSIFLNKGKKVNLFCGENKTTSNNIFLYPNFNIQQIKKNKKILIGFETLKLEKTYNFKNGIYCEVVQGGILDSNKGVHINQNINLNPFTKKDIEACKIGEKYKIKNYALSFANSAEDVRNFRKIFKTKVKIISKLETKNGFLQRDEIIKESSAVLIDRGDLSRYISISQIPIAQKIIATSSNKKRKPFYVATNLLETMITKKEPTRAESNDIFSSLQLNCSGLVLAAETAIGKYPIESINFIKESIKNFLKFKKIGESKFKLKF